MEVVQRFSPSGENRFHLLKQEVLVVMDLSELKFARRFDKVTGSAIREIIDEGVMLLRLLTCLSLKVFPFHTKMGDNDFAVREMEDDELANTSAR